jgi:hypothetical protein
MASTAHLGWMGMQHEWRNLFRLLKQHLGDH